MGQIWDYNKKELEKTEKGKILLLERAINYGPDEGEKISLSETKRHWKTLHLFPRSKKLMELLIWGKIQSSTKISE